MGTVLSKPQDRGQRGSAVLMRQCGSNRGVRLWPRWTCPAAPLNRNAVARHSSIRAALEKPASDAEGLLYMMHRLDADGTVIPCYIGKAGRHGRSGTN